MTYLFVISINIEQIHNINEKKNKHSSNKKSHHFHHYFYLSINIF